MGRHTTIEWTDRTFNPWQGCRRVSPGCEHCYAEARDVRFDGGKHWGPRGERRVTSAANWRQPIQWNREAKAIGVRDRVFCASLADVFEDRRDLDEPRALLWGVILATPHLDWLLLTKRPQNVRGMVPSAWRDAWPRNVWIGTTVEDQKRADERIPVLLTIPAPVRFLSMEPLLERVDLGVRSTRSRERPTTPTSSPARRGRRASVARSTGSSSAASRAPAPARSRSSGRARPSRRRDTGTCRCS